MNLVNLGIMVISYSGKSDASNSFDYSDDSADSAFHKVPAWVVVEMSCDLKCEIHYSLLLFLSSDKLTMICSRW